MSSIKKNTTGKKLKVNKGANIVIVRSEYNAGITEALEKSCISELKKTGAARIRVMNVPGAWEIPFACAKAAKKKPDAIIAIGCLIKGETPHFDFIAKEVARGIMDLSLQKGIPVIFGVLTTLTPAQAKARIKGGKRGDKGVEAARAAVRMINLNVE
jgi:6,7-dimethyl-8-ribityllumazine synthase